MTVFLKVVSQLYHAQSSSTGLWNHVPASGSSDADSSVAYHMATLESLLVLRTCKFECIESGNFLFLFANDKFINLAKITKALVAICIVKFLFYSYV